MKFNKALIFSLMFFIILLSLGMAAADDDQTDGNSTGNNTTDLNQSEEYSNVTEDMGIVNGTLPIYPPENNATTDISYAAYERYIRIMVLLLSQRIITLKMLQSLMISMLPVIRWWYCCLQFPVLVWLH